MIFHSIGLYVLLLLLATLIFFACEKEHGELVFDNPNESNNSKNLLLNGGFEQNSIDPWYTFNVGDSVITTELVTTGAIEGKNCLHIKILRRGLNIWDAGLEQRCILKKNKVYTFSAYIKSPNNLKVKLSLLPSVEPYIAYSEMMISAANTWQQYHITSRPMIQDVQSALVVFHFASDVGEFLVDDVRLYEEEYVP